MFYFISRYISAVSLAAVTALSLFNVGYFWKIGLHFVGLVDLTNLVYSAGLAIVPIFLGILAAGFASPRRPKLWMIIILGIIGGALILWGTSRFGPRSHEPELMENGAILLGMVISLSAFLTWTLDRYRQTNQWDWRDTAVLLLISFGTAFQAGMLMVSLELSDRITYTVTTKSDLLEHARLLRSSSTGFILAVNGSVMFVPLAEVKTIKSDVGSK